MLEQWEADNLLHLQKVYTVTTAVTLSGGVDNDYPIESADGAEHFLLDVAQYRRNINKARFQLRFRRDIVLARMCTAVPHTNPDGERLAGPHFHSYREGYEDRWAEQLTPFESTMAALMEFCKRINLPIPDIQGGSS
jgi:hypothetical protein